MSADHKGSRWKGREGWKSMTCSVLCKHLYDLDGHGKRYGERLEFKCMQDQIVKTFSYLF